MGESPAKGLDPNNFTIEWNGFIRPPISGD